MQLKAPAGNQSNAPVDIVKGRESEDLPHSRRPSSRRQKLRPLLVRGDDPYRPQTTDQSFFSRLSGRQEKREMNEQDIPYRSRSAQSDAVAKIALDMQPGSVETPLGVREILNALNKAYHAGFMAGSEATLKHHAQTAEVIEKLFK
jgi:hypothetical protein